MGDSDEFYTEDAGVETPTAPAYESTYGGYDDNGNTDPENVAAEEVGLGLDKQVAALGVLVSSVCVMMSSTKFFPDGNGYETYALVSGILGALIGILMLALMRLAPNVANGPILMPLLSGTLAVYWIVASMITTFKEPFAQLGNGYIAVYASTIFSFILLLEVLPSGHKTRVYTSMKGASDAMYAADVNKRWVGLCLVASIVEMIEGAIICDKYCHTTLYGGGKQKLSGYAVAVGVISVIVCLVMLVSAVPKPVKNYSSLFLAIWWSIGLIVLTFGSATFTVQLMNGYLGTWAAAIASYGLVIPLVAQFGWFGSGQMSDYDEVGAGYNDGIAGEDNYNDIGHSSYAEGTGGAV